MKGKWLLASGVVILLAIAAGALWVWRQDHAKKAAPREAAAQQTPAALAPGAEISLSGKVQATHVVEVPAAIEGAIDVFHVEVGQEVYEGQLLASIKNTTLESSRDLAAQELEQVQTRVINLDSSIISARLEASRAAADASRSRSEFERQQKLFQRQQLLYREGATPRLTYERTQKDFLAAQDEFNAMQGVAAGQDEKVASLTREAETARRILSDKHAELERAKSDLAATEVHAPVDGIVLARRGEPGLEVSREVKDLFQIATDLGSLQVVLSPEPPMLARIEPGEPALVFLAEVANEPLAGIVSAVKDNQVLVDFESPTPAIKPGLTAQVRLKIK
jgi:multidrug resistance efflux pump